MLTTRVRHVLIALGSAVILIGVYAVAGFIGVPYVLRSQAQQFVQEHYGRALSLGEIRFNPFTLALDIRDLSLPDADQQPLLSFQRLFLNLEVASLWRRGASFGAIALEQPYVRTLIRSDRALNLADLAKPFAGEPPAKPAPAAKEPTRLFIDDFRITGGALSFEDRTPATPFRARLAPITFHLQDFSTTGKTGNAYSLQGTSSAGERLSWSGTFGLQPLASRGRFELSQVQARTLWSYLQDSLGFEVSSGVVGVSGRYDFAAASPGVALTVDVSSVDVSDLGIRPRQRDERYAHLQHIQIENARVDLARARVDVGKVRIVGGEVLTRRAADGSINLLELSKAPAPAAPVSSEQTGAASADSTNASSPEAASTTPAPTAPESSPPATRAQPSRWVVSAPDLGIEGVKVTLEDQLVAPAAAFTLAPIDVQLAGFSTSPNAKVEVDANIGVNGSGLVKVRGTVVPSGPTFNGQIETKDIDLTAFQPYVGSYTQMTLTSGALSTHLDLNLAQDGAFTVKGDSEVSKLRTVDNALKKDFIKWDQLNATGIEFSSKPAKLSINAVSARAPYLRVIIAPDQTVNIAQVLSAPANAPAPVQTVRMPTQEPTPVGAAQPIPVSIGVVRVTNASANFADFWIQPNYAVSIQELNGSITGLSSASRSRAKVKLDGKVDRYAPAHITGDVNLLSASLYTDLALSFKGVELTSVTPYSGRFAGYRIEKGKLSVDLAYHVENRQLQAQQRFVIDQLQLGERVESKDAVHLPLRLAVALLKDRNGVIDIGLPLTGSLDDPKFRIGPIIWKAVINLLTKIVTAPFALLGNLFGGGEEMNLVDFEPGDATLTPAAAEKMAALVKAMQDRPQLQLDVPSIFSPEVDGPALTAKKLAEKLAQTRAATTDEKPSAKRKKPPRDAAAAAAAAAEAEAALREQSAATAADFEELAQARARAIQDALLGKGAIEATRVFMLAPNPKPPKDGKVRLELSLK